MKSALNLGKTKSTLALISASLVAGTALAMGLINPSTVQDRIQYRDAGFLQNGETTEAIVQAVEKPQSIFAGSGSEPSKSYELRITLTRQAGSVTEQERFVGDLDAEESPAAVEVYRADDKFKPAGSSSEGLLEISRFDRDALSGRLLESNLSARPESIAR